MRQRNHFIFLIVYNISPDVFFISGCMLLRLCKVPFYMHLLLTHASKKPFHFSHCLSKISLIKSFSFLVVCFLVLCKVQFPMHLLLTHASKKPFHFSQCLGKISPDVFFISGCMLLGSAYFSTEVRPLRIYVTKSGYKSAYKTEHFVHSTLSVTFQAARYTSTRQLSFLTSVLTSI